MRHLIPIIILLAVNIASGQCKYERNEIDDFEKVRVVSTKPVKVYQNTFTVGGIYLSFFKWGDNISVSAEILSQESHCFNDQSELLIMTDDDQVIRLPYRDEIECSNIMSASTYIINQSFPRFTITSEQLQELKNKKLSKIRIYTSGQTFEFDINKNNSCNAKGLSYLMSNVKCILDI